MSFNNPETQRPLVGHNDKYSYEIIDTFNYCWSDRIRIPVPYENRKERLSESIITKALKEHNSQRIITRADRIINSDEVFFVRRTDSLTYRAKLSVTSGDPQHICDFMLYNISSIDSSSFSLSKYAWKPEELDKYKCARFEWEHGEIIEEICLYGTYSDDSSIDKILVRLSDGYETVVYGLSQSGFPLSIYIGEHKNIVWCEISILAYSGNDYGISECEIFSSSYSSVIKPFCKILIDNNFIYDYVCSEEISTIQLGIYKFGICDDIELEVHSGNSIIEDSILLIDKNDRIIIIIARNKSGDIYDKISINRITNLELFRYKNIDEANRRYIWLEKRKLKIHNAMFMFKQKGFIPVMKRAWRNLIKPKLMRSI